MEENGVKISPEMRNSTTVSLEHIKCKFWLLCIKGKDSFNSTEDRIIMPTVLWIELRYPIPELYPIVYTEKNVFKLHNYFYSFNYKINRYKFDTMFKSGSI